MALTSIHCLISIPFKLYFLLFSALAPTLSPSLPLSLFSFPSAFVSISYFAVFIFSFNFTLGYFVMSLSPPRHCQTI